MTNNNKSQLGNTIKELRERNQKSQEDVAQYLAIPRSSLSQIESGNRDLSSLELAKLSELFVISADAILSGDIENHKLSQKELHQPKSKKSVRISVPKLNKKKFKEVLLYILNQTSGKPNVGETVLYKLLYFCDFNYYEKYEEQLTGAKYIKNTYGPTPVSFKAVIEEMLKDKEIVIDKNKYHGYEQTRYIPLTKADLRAINGAEKEVIDDVLHKLSSMPAKQISDYSHEDTPWKVAKMREEIQYEAVFYRSAAYSVREYDEL